MGLPGAAKFIRNSANILVTYARLAMKGVRVPYTNNRVERLMGEVAKRVKNKSTRPQRKFMEYYWRTG